MKDKSSYLLSCWPDGYSRYYSVVNILKIVFELKINILDVGGDSEWMSKFLDIYNLDYSLNIVDTRDPDFKNLDPRITYTKKDFFELSLDNKNLPDAIINTDVLEHIPAKDKVHFINKCIESARSLVIISAPHEDSEVTFFEKEIENQYIKYKNESQYWLREHFEFGKPETRMIEDVLKKQKLSYVVVDTNNLKNWYITFSMNFINSEIVGLKGMDELNRFYNQNILSVGDFSDKPYRKIFIIFKNTELFIEKQAEIKRFFGANNLNNNNFISQTFDLITSNFDRLNKELNKNYL
jgi:2-polyprenyl-3-methyl-5-hydroxy-6-metoxy-1,4-benzoquinol methylase